MPCAIRRICIDSPAVSSDGTNGKPPDSSVDNMRENTATWYFSQMSPSKGIFNLKRSVWVAPRSLFIQRQTKNPTIASTTRTYGAYSRAPTPMVSINWVIAGKLAPSAEYKVANCGTTNVMRNVSITTNTTTSSAG